MGKIVTRKLIEEGTWKVQVREQGNPIITYRT
jgi:hypothetical protein